jgi:hypothetical protein
MKRFILASAAVLLGLFALTAAFGHAAPKDTALVPPGPLIRPCVFPGTAELADLAGASDLVVDGTVVGSAQVIHYAGIAQPFTRYMLRVRSVLRGSTPSSVLTIEEAGGVPVPILQPGPQITFLQLAQRTDGLTTYFVVSGLDGTFLIKPTGVTRECPRGQAASVYARSPQTEASFSDQVHQLTASMAPHK